METASLVFAILSFVVAFLSLLAMICVAKSTSKFSKNQSNIEKRLWEENEHQLTIITKLISDFMNSVITNFLKVNINIEKTNEIVNDMDDKLDNF